MRLPSKDGVHRDPKTGTTTTIKTVSVWPCGTKVFSGPWKEGDEGYPGHPKRR